MAAQYKKLNASIYSLKHYQIIIKLEERSIYLKKR